MHTRKKENFLFCLGSTVISLIGILLIMKSNGFYPFKDTTLFTFDMKEQYLSFFASLRYLFNGDDSIFYNWSDSLGGNYFSLYAYYLSSPFSWMTVLFSLEKLPLAVFLMTVCKISLSGLTFSIYLNFMWDKYHVIPEQTGAYHRLLAHFSLLPLTVAYALMSYNLQYSVSIMWLDGVIMLPLILLGVEKLLNGKSILYFVLPMTMLFYFNFYTSYMVGIFSALYLFSRLVASYSADTRKENLQIIKKYFLSALLSLGLAAPLLLPAFVGILNGKLSDSLSSVVHESSFITYPLTDILKQFRNGAVNYLGLAGRPNIYCGYLILLLSILFLFFRRIPLKDRLAAFSLTAFLFLSFYIRPLDNAWHCFMMPYSFNARYSFLFSFCLLYMSCRILCAIPYHKLPCLTGQTLRLPVTESILLLFLLLTSADMGLNGRAIFRNIDYATPYMRLEEYNTYLNNSRTLISEIESTDTGMYRITQDYQLTYNDPMLWGYKGMYHYSSTYNSNVNSLTSHLGLEQDWMWTSGNGVTPLTSSLLGIRYLLYADGRTQPDYYSLYAGNDSVRTYYNPDALEFFYSAPAVTMDPEFTSDPFRNQNNYLNALCGTEEHFFTDYDTTFTSPATDFPHDLEEDPLSSWEYQFCANSPDPIYLYLSPTPFASVNIYVNGEFIGAYEYGKSIYCLYLGSFEVDEPVTVTVVSYADTSAGDCYIASLDTGALQSALSRLHSREISLTSHSFGSLSGTISVSSGETIITSIPYDSGWRIKLDGNKLPDSELATFAGTFLAIKAAPGDHFIEMSYISPGFIPGVVIFCITLLLWIFVRFLQLYRNRKTTIAQSENTVL